MTRIHDKATASSAGLLRIVIFGIWIVIPIAERLPLLADLPTEAFVAPGPMALLPDSVMDLLTSVIGFWAITGLVVLGSAIVVLGVVPYRWTMIVVAGLILFEQGVARGFSGHINHAELALAYCTLAISIFPLYDGLSLRRTTSAENTPDVMYRVPFLLCMLIFTISFSFVGVARLSEGFDLLSSNTLRNLLAEKWVEGIATQEGASRALPWYLDSSMTGATRVAFAITTSLEILAPLSLLYRPTRIGFVFFAIGFHLVNLILLGVTFFENLILLSVFSEKWFHNVAGRLQESTSNEALAAPDAA